MPTNRANASISVLALVLLAFVAHGFSRAPRQASSEIRKPLIYVIGEYLHVNASGPRPLLQAIDALEEEYGWAVNYEDPQYLALPGSAAGQPIPSHRRRSQMAGANDEGGFSFRYHIGANPNTPPDEEKVLNAVVDAYNQSDGTGRFKLLRQEGGAFSIIGVGVRSANEQFIEQSAALDLPVTLERERRSAAETIAIICRSVAQQSHIKISLGALVEGLDKGAPVVVGGSGVSARALLERTLLAMGGNLCWRLLYESDSRSYRLDIKPARPNPSACSLHEPLEVHLLNPAAALRAGRFGSSGP